MSDIEVGMRGEFAKCLTDDDIHAFAEASGDHNPVHLDDDYARRTQFGERICHGMLTAGLISAVFGSVFPGPGWIYVSQSLRFRAPVSVGQEVTASVEVTNVIPEKNFVEFETECRVHDKVVLAGKATLMAPQYKS